MPGAPIPDQPPQMTAMPPCEEFPPRLPSYTPQRPQVESIFTWGTLGGPLAAVGGPIAGLQGASISVIGQVAMPHLKNIFHDLMTGDYGSLLNTHGPWLTGDLVDGDDIE